MNWRVLDFDVGGSSAYMPKEKHSVLAAAAIGAGVSALGGLLSSSMQNSANANLDRENREWQEKMWHESNAYNAPVEQRKRLEAAGINPALAFQNGNTGVAANAPTPNQHAPADYSALGAGISNAAAAYFNATQQNAQTELIKSQVQGQRIENQYKALEKISQIQKTIEDRKKTGADTKLLEWELQKNMDLYDATYKQAYADVERTKAESALANARVREADANSEFQTIVNKYAPSQQKIITSNLAKESNRIDSEVARNNADAALTAANKALSDAQKQGVDIDNNTKGRMARAIVNQKFAEADAARFEAGITRKRYYTGEAGQKMPVVPYDKRLAPPPVHSSQRKGGVR